MSALLTANGSTGLMTPYLGRLVAVQDMAPEIKLLRVEMLDGGVWPFAGWQPGQFAFLSAFGVGEAPFGIASTPERGPWLDFAVQRLGSVTTELHLLDEGTVVGVRGPLGNGFPMEAFKGKDLLVMGGGIGGAPLRPVLHTILDHRGDYGHLTILWAARNPSLLLFRDEYDEWRAAPDTELHLTVDEPDDHWTGHTGLITALLEKVDPAPKNTVAITCGPPIMIYYANQTLHKLGFAPEACYVTLEARMHCGIGKCGRCNLGEKLICVDGPVFSMAEVGHLLESFL
jgi:sulfhydrogenase subunit gamma (sulfur reductase)